MSRAQFIVEAKRATYAADADPERLTDGSKRLVFEEGPFRYVDTYFGTDPFFGHEVVFENGTPCWGMNYWGAVVADHIGPESFTAEVYGFLRVALSAVNEDIPFRGPQELGGEEFRYKSETVCWIYRFIGTERIFLQGEEVYVGEYHGGRIQ